MDTSHKKIKLAIFPLLLFMVLFPHYLYYQYDWVKYIYLVAVPIITIKQEVEKYKFKKVFSNIDLTSYFIQSITLTLCFMDNIFIEIFVWQISLGVIGIFVGLFYDVDLYENKYLRIWSRFTFFAVFIYFMLMNFNFIY